MRLMLYIIIKGAEMAYMVLLIGSDFGTEILTNLLALISWAPLGFPLIVLEVSKDQNVMSDPVPVAHLRTAPVKLRSTKFSPWTYPAHQLLLFTAIITSCN